MRWLNGGSSICAHRSLSPAAFGYGVTVTELRDTFDRQARVRHREEQNTADRWRSTPTVHSRAQTGHVITSPRCIAATRRRACSRARHRRDLHVPEQNTAAAEPSRQTS
ncbi:hypothetical protein GCM10009837_40290 [Streptomyces durmitorensis]